MGWKCHAHVADDCVDADLFDAPYKDPDGNPICLPCARELGMHDVDTDRPSWARDDPREPLGFTDLRALKPKPDS